jgi:SNARE protein 1
MMMNTSEHILHDRVNLVRLVRRLDKSINEVNWGSEPSPILWFRSEGLLQVGAFVTRSMDIQ